MAHRRPADGRAAPLDEVRSALAIFDETLFTVVPGFHRAIDRALDAARADGPGGAAMALATMTLASDDGRTGTRPVTSPTILRLGSWIGADRDGHPGVTAETTLHAARLQADHLLRGYEAVAGRLMQTIAAGSRPTASIARWAARSPATRRSSPRSCASSAAGSRTSPTVSDWGRSQSGCDAPGRR